MSVLLCMISAIGRQILLSLLICLCTCCGEFEPPGLGGGAGGAKGKFGWSGLCDRGLQEKKRKTFLSLPCFRPCIQLFWERSSEKVPAIIRKVLWVAFEFTVLQRNLKERHERPWTYVCECYMIATEVGSTATLSENSDHIQQPFSK